MSAQFFTSSDSKLVHRYSLWFLSGVKKRGVGILVTTLLYNKLCYYNCCLFVYLANKGPKQVKLLFSWCNSDCISVHDIFRTSLTWHEFCSDHIIRLFKLLLLHDVFCAYNTRVWLQENKRVSSSGHYRVINEFTSDKHVSSLSIQAMTEQLQEFVLKLQTPQLISLLNSQRLDGGQRRRGLSKHGFSALSAEGRLLHCRWGRWPETSLPVTVEQFYLFSLKVKFKGNA